LRRAYFFAQSRDIGVKQFAVITIVLGLCCATALADGTSRGFTSTQTVGTGGGGGSLDALLNSSKTLSAKDAKDKAPGKPKDFVFKAPIKQVKRGVVKDDRKVTVTKEANDPAPIAPKTKVADSLFAKSITVRSTLADKNISYRTPSTTQFSPFPKASQ
jgi:hypothetical protein